MIELNRFKDSLRSFSLGYRSKKYDKQFNEFWLWKHDTELISKSILNEENVTESWKKLRKILRGWQTYRGTKNEYTYRDLKNSLTDIFKAYDELRSFTILDFDRIPRHHLESIWNALGRVKEPDGKENDSGEYFVIAICKPLMLLWGQTLAFDKYVRLSLPKKYGVWMNEHRWNFTKWYDVMKSISDNIQLQPKIIEYLEKESSRRFGPEARIPYGRFLDIYYFEKNR